MEIADNGPGIPLQLQKEIFEPDVTTKRSGLSFGLGLGLSIVKKIVTGHEGNIHISSSEKGTSFKIKYVIWASLNTVFGPPQIRHLGAPEAPFGRP